MPTPTAALDLGVAASARRKAYQNIVLPLFLVSIVAYLDRVNIGYAALTMNRDLGFGPQVFGLGAGILFAGYLLFAVPGALIAERFSPRLWLAAMLLAWGLCSALMAWMRTPAQFYLLRFLLGAAEASLYPVIYACCIPRWFPARDRARAIALLLTSLQLSSIVGAPLAGWLIGFSWPALQGWQLLFLLEAAPALLLAVAIVFWMADSPRQARWLSEAECAQVLHNLDQDAGSPAGRQRSVLRVLAEPRVLQLCLIYFLWITGFWGFTFWTPTVLKQISHWSNLDVGVAIAAAMLLSLGASVYTGHSSSLRNERRWHAAALLFLAALGMAGEALAHNTTLSYACLVLTAIGVYAPMAVWWSYPTTFLSGAAAASAVGLINSLGNIGGFVGPYLTGWVRERTASFSAALLMLAFALAAAGALILTLPRSSPTE